MKGTLLAGFLTILNLIICCWTLKAQQPTHGIDLRQIKTILQRAPGFRPVSGKFNRSLPSPANFKQPLQKQLTPLGQPACQDSSMVYYLQAERRIIYPQYAIKSRSGEILLAGALGDTILTNQISGLLIKMDESGNIIWSKYVDTLAPHKEYSSYDYYRIIELQDGSIIWAGETWNAKTSYYENILTKTDQSGNIIWNKTYASRVWIPGAPGGGSGAYNYLQDIKQDPFSGDIYFSVTHWDEGRSLTRINVLDGSVVWSKLYQEANSDSNFDRPCGVLFLPDELIFWGNFVGPTKMLTGAYRINKINGDTLATKFFSIDHPLGDKLQIIIPDHALALSNGNFMVHGLNLGMINYQLEPGSTNQVYSTIEFDRNLNIIKAFAYQTDMQINYDNSGGTVFPDGSGVLALLDPDIPSGFHLNYVQFKDGQILKQRKITYASTISPIYSYGRSYALQLSGGGNLSFKSFFDLNTLETKMEVRQMRYSDSSCECLGYDDNSTSVFPFSFKTENWGLDSIGDHDFYEEVPRATRIASIPLAYSPGCQVNTVCDSLSLISSTDPICNSDPLIVTARRNKSCHSLINFDFKTAPVSSYQQLNDSTYAIYFSKGWAGKIYGMLNGCTNLIDSLDVTIKESGTKPFMGEDSSICPNQTLTLQAGPGYQQYQWQDGSTDPTYIVTQPGTYWVQVTDGCNRILSDTINVTATSIEGFSAGNDQTVCMNTPVELKASDGFIVYEWTNNQDAAVLNTQQLSFIAAKDVSYFVKAIKSSGCFAYDTVNVFVNLTPKITLGEDTSFCSGNSLLLDAGPGFQTYAWNNGFTGQKQTVSTAGYWWVKAYTDSGCLATDSIQINAVWETPTPVLNKNPVLCEGETRTLDPGNFASYLWQDGSEQKQLEVSQPGTYSVSVKNNFGCENADTTTITQIIPHPENFLQNDTTICNYGKLTLAPGRNFQQYLWSTGSTAGSITVTAGGRYWLQGVDQFGCKGTDTIQVTQKECLIGLFVPNAFTPNHDGKNDHFKPILLGPLTYYHFTIYNRFGEKIFETTDLSRGWDGELRGRHNDSNNFVWTCTYQLDGQPKKQEKGFVVLIR